MNTNFAKRHSNYQCPKANCSRRVRECCNSQQLRTQKKVHFKRSSLYFKISALSCALNAPWHANSFIKTAHTHTHTATSTSLCATETGLWQLFRPIGGINCCDVAGAYTSINLIWPSCLTGLSLIGGFHCNRISKLILSLLIFRKV